MSWDNFVQDFPMGVKTVNDIPPNCQPRFIGTRSAITAAILEAAPFTRFRDATWGTIAGSGFCIDVNLGEHENLKGFVFHVREANETGLGILCDVLTRIGLRAVASGEFLERDTAFAAYRVWRNYKGKVTGDS